MKHVLPLWFLLCWLPAGLLAQTLSQSVPGSLTLPDGQTVSGRVDQPVRATVVTITTGPDQVQTVAARRGGLLRLQDGRVYTAVAVPLSVTSDSGQVWAEALVTNGPLHLYRYRLSTAMSSALLVVWQGRPLDLPQRRLAEHLADSLPPCGSEPVRWKGIGANAERLAEAVQAYNRCVGSPAAGAAAAGPAVPMVTPKQRRGERYYAIGVVGGVQRLVYSTGTLNGMAALYRRSYATDAIGPIGGVRFSVGNTASRKLEGFVQVAYLTHQDEFPLYDSFGDPTGHVAVHDLSFLTASLGARYYLRLRRVRPFAELNLSLFWRQENNNRLPINPRLGSANLGTIPVGLFQTQWIAFVGGLGAQVDLGPRWVAEGAVLPTIVRLGITDLPINSASSVGTPWVHSVQLGASYRFLR